MCWKKGRPKMKFKHSFLPNILHDFLVITRVYSRKCPIKFCPTMGMAPYPPANFYEYLQCFGNRGVDYWNRPVIVEEKG